MEGGKIREIIKMLAFILILIHPRLSKAADEA